MKTVRIILYVLSVAIGISCSRTGSENCCSDSDSLLTADGLSNQRVSSFAEDEHGHIWIGTFRGLN